MYEILKLLQENNRTYKKLNPAGIVVHETATPGASDEDESRYFDVTPRKASVHVFIDWDSITQKIPFDEVAWHAGPTANNKYLGIELCRPKEHDKNKFQQVWIRAVWCFAYILVNYIHEANVTQKTLPSHADCSRWWHETDHTDPEGYFAEYKKTADEFRSDVQSEIEKQLGIMTFKQYEMRELNVTASVLNCRRGPGVQYGIIKQFIKGDHVTATGSADKWWKLDINGVPGYIYKIYAKESSSRL